MKIHLTNGLIYRIPKGVRLAKMSISFSYEEIETCMSDIRKMRMESMFEENKDVLDKYVYIGHQNVAPIHMGMKTEDHIFIDKEDMVKCSVSLEEP